jgi:flagellar biosynthesis/type III secretory pathway protein FliH
MRKKYPSQIRYEKNNPTITFRMTKEEKERIEQMAAVTGTSVSDLVRMALFELEKEITGMYQDAYDDGFASGKQEGFKEGEVKGRNKWAI